MARNPQGRAPNFAGAPCLSEDAELFFPIGNTGPAILQIEEAKQVCRRCHIREQCLEWALDGGFDDGVWGGLSEDERRAVKRQNAKAAAQQEQPEQPEEAEEPVTMEPETPEWPAADLRLVVDNTNTDHEDIHVA